MKKINRAKNKKLWVVIIIFICFYLYVSNNWIQNTRYNISSDKIDKSIRIVHLSDLHGKQFGKGNRRLIKNIMKEEPEIIVFTGDLIDAYRNTNIKESVQFLEQLSHFAPVYYIRGNHEYNTSRYQELMNYLNEVQGDLYILDGGYQNIKLKGNNFSILGLDRSKKGVMDNFLSEKGYKIILNHYSENFSENDNLSRLNVDLVLTGHAHGGQWRLPIVGGVYSPGQGFNPKYYQGINEDNGSIQVISRGLGNSIFPFRICNRPEVITIIIE
ncbi:metallophosphoesterase [Lutibacter sp. B2]|nr:metallophosphoesterase [Lutibacter sp. B2]